MLSFWNFSVVLHIWCQIYCILYIRIFHMISVSLLISWLVRVFFFYYFSIFHFYSSTNLDCRMESIFRLYYKISSLTVTFFSLELNLHTLSDSTLRHLLELLNKSVKTQFEQRNKINQLSVRLTLTSTCIYNFIRSN